MASLDTLVLRSLLRCRAVMARFNVVAVTVCDSREDYRGGWSVDDVPVTALTLAAGLTRAGERLTTFAPANYDADQRKAGIKKDIADAIADGRRPAGMSADEEMVYDFSAELHKNKRVSDATYARVEARFGKKAVVDLTGINAYYTLLAMQMNVAHYKGPADMKKLPRIPQ